MVSLSVAWLLVAGCPSGRPPVRAGPLPASVTWRADGARMVLVPAGTVRVDLPPAEVQVEGFYIDRYEVTCARYARYLNAVGRSESDSGLTTAGARDLRRIGRKWQPVAGTKWHPVQVGFEGATAYCRWAGKALPGWEQWLRAAVGDDGRRFPWGNAWDPSRCVCRESSGRLQPVGSRSSGASPFTAQDMAGNVQEWVRLSRAQRRAAGRDADRALAGGGYEGDSGGDVDRGFGQLLPAVHMAECEACRYGTGFRCVAPCRDVDGEAPGE